MALFGNALTQRPPAPPQQRRPWDTPGIGDGLPGPIDAMGGVNAAMAQNATQRPSGGFFGQGGPGRAIAGSIGDFLLQNAGAAPVYAPTMQNKLRERMAQLEEERQYRTWVKQQEYKRANPDPVRPHRWESNDGSLMEYDPSSGGVRQVYKDPTPKINWVQVKDPVTGAINIVPMGATGPMGSASESSEDEWEYEDGGPSPSGSGTFR